MLRHEFPDRTFLRRATAAPAMGSGPRYSSAGGDALPDRISECPRALRCGDLRAVIDQPQYRDFMADAIFRAALGGSLDDCAGTGSQADLRQRQDSRHCGCHPANETGRYDALELSNLGRQAGSE